ncbi:TetR/AcrR family transcriptional regulator [Undibacterium sp.]|jgi:AcrR family transcriptional regulator|uniref:TetR/AcrR family transcriptional regulator n=1 Tax=Undibacterium sp. TaxID=1914977 RepID=UPI002C9D78AA|nr:TetR/AcrR family transcriptional regulator [Undibacterium sp.]HTD06123.1 TetR/AcrR family transcriptional regulator [Undibacterium sp.]
MPPDLKPRWERRKDARPQELLAAALDLFVERGFAATRLDDIAKSAGVSKGTLYLYFSSKEELFKTVVRENVVPMIGQAEELVEQFTGSSADLFREIFMSWWYAVGNTKLSGLSKLMIAEAGNFPELAQFYNEEVIARSDAMVVRMLKRGIARGEIRPLNLEMAPRILIAPIIMQMISRHSGNACSVQDDELAPYIDAYLELVLNGMLA